MKKSTWVFSLFLIIVFAGLNEPLRAQIPDNKIQGSGKVTDFIPSSGSKEALSLFREGLNAYDLGESRKARSLFTKAIEKDPEFGLAYLLRANTSNSTKEYAEDLKQGKARVANATEWEKLFAEYQYTNLSGDREKGISLAKKITETHPDAARAYADLGNAYSGNKQYAEAEQAYKKAIELNPSWIGGYNGLVDIYLFSDKKDLAKAEQNALKLVSLAPNSPGAHIILGDTYRAKNNFQQAAEEYKKSIKLDNKAAEGYYKLGHANVYAGRTAEARKNFKDAGDRDNRKTFAEMMEASTYAYEGDSKKTMKQLMEYADKYAAAGSDKVDNQAELNFLNAAATIAVHNGDAEALKKLIPRIAPLSKEAMQSVGTPEALLWDESDQLHWEIMMDYTEGRLGEAKEKSEKIKAILEPINDSRKLEGYYQDLGMINLKEKNYKEAISNLKQANPQNIYTKYLLAKAYEGLGDQNQAMTYYSEVGHYNFNNIENSLVRNEVKKKLKQQ